MKEYLNKNTYEYKLAHCMFGHSEWVEIPTGAEIAIKFNIDDDEHGVIFYKNDGKASAPEKNNFEWDYGSQWSNAELLDENFADGDIDLSHKVLWQRQQQPGALPFIDDNPQSLNEQYAEIEQVRQAIKVKSGSDSDHMADAMSYGLMGGIDATLAQRQSTYGNFEDVAFVTENIMGVLGRVRVNGLSELPNTHRMALYMISSKMARIVNGDFNHFDSWHDIGGYARLIEDLVKENNNG